jgi:serine protease
MKQHQLVVALGTALAMALSLAAQASQPDPNRVMIKFTPGAKGNVAAALRGAGAQIHHELDIADAFAATVPPQALDGLRRNPNIEFIEQDIARYPMGQVTPYGVPMVQAPTLVATGADGTGIKVCVIDSGIKANHEDFAGISMTGYATAASGWNTDSCGHGTHVAGTIAAANNGLGVVGVSPGKVSLHIIKVFDGASCGWTYSSSLIDAAQRCQAAGAKIINMSLGGSTSSTTERNGFDTLNAAGILSIAAAGNAGNTTMSYPASYSSVMSVAAIDANKALASFSQRNSQVEIAAPGVGVLSTYPITGGSLTVGSTGYMATAMEGSPAASASGNLVNGGRCTSAGAWAGLTVLCERGDIAFADKVLNAQAGGARGVVLYNNVAGGFSGTLGTSATTIPSVAISQEDGQFLVANRLGQNATVDARSLTNANGYEYLDGTSMATPHVAGVAAIVWSAKSTATNTEVRNALTSTAEDLGSAGRDTSFGFGLVRAFAAADALINGSSNPPPPPATAPSSLTGTKTRSGKKYTYRLNWSGGATTIDIFRGNTKIRSAVSNTGSYSETLNNVTGATYRVCNAGSTTDCSNSLTL